MELPFTPALWPTPLPTEILTGKRIRLEPLANPHVSGLTTAGADPAIWVFTTSRGDSPQAMQQYVANQLRDWERGLAAPFAVRDLTTNSIVGCTRMKEIDRQHRHAIVGSWYHPMWWRSGANLEAKLLLLRYAFENLGCVRIEFHADARNTRSRDSLEQLGATFEGILRVHQITRDGTLRDSAIYSVLSREWPAVRDKIASRLR